MNKLISFLLIFLIFLFSFLNTVNAIYDPLSVPNNKFGIHIIDENDLENAADLVNSSGGAWGYVTMVVTENDRMLSKWQNIFSRMEKHHLIPILRLATSLDGNVWKKPKIDDADSWADFLSQLSWPVKNRYLILFNEPNHAKEWGGEINPEGYAEILKIYSSKLKNCSSDFFILPAGLDASAPNSMETMDEIKFIRSMLDYDKNIFEFIDGWTSHSYPNPGFRGNTKVKGRGTLRTHEWEIGLLKSFGVNQNFLIFITETGWFHQEGEVYNPNFYSADQVSDMFAEAMTSIWNDPDIAAVTPFILNYQSYPFSNFSWQKINSNEFYPQYDAYRSHPKLAGQPQLNLNLKTQPTITENKVLGKGTENMNMMQAVISLFFTVFNL